MAITSKLYEGLTPEQLRSAEAIGETKAFASGELIIREGETGDTMFLVLNGKIEISKNLDASQRQVLGTIGPGDYFGEMTVVDAQPRSANATAAEAVKVRVLRRADLDRLAAVAPQVLFNLLKGSGDRLRAMNKQYIDKIVHQAKLSVVGQMANSIVHDLKNPMTVIRMNAELLGRAPANAKQCSVITRNVDRITYMVNDLLDYARGTIRLNKREVDPAKWLADLGELLEPLAGRFDVKYQPVAATKQPMVVDPDKLTRAVYNLASNGIDAMQDGGILGCRISSTEKDFLVDISDTGGGIPEAIRDRLFGEFVTYGKPSGTGLGTSIAKKIVEEHGGTISFTTATGKGTTFHLVLPRVTAG